MADMHILDGPGRDRVRIAMHIPITDLNNDVAVSYRTALVRSGLGGTTVLPDGDGNDGTISAAEKAAITSGQIIEYIEEVLIESDGTAQAKRVAAAREAYSKAKTRVQAHIQNRLRYYGATLAEA